MNKNEVINVNTLTPGERSALMNQLINKEIEGLKDTVSELKIEHEKSNERISKLEHNTRMEGWQERKINSEGRKAVVRALGGKDTKAYKELSKRVFPKFWGEFNRHFGIPRYGELLKKDYEKGLEFIDSWTPDTSTRLEIEAYNKQQAFDI